MSTTPALHLMIATGQNLANLIPALQCEAREAWVLQTPDMRASARHLAHALKSRGITAHRKDFADDDPDSIERQAERIAEELDGRPVTINVTGGTKLMTLALTQTLARHLETGGPEAAPHVVYCDTQHRRLVWLAPHTRSEAMADVLQLNDVLLVQGYRRLGGNGGAEAAERQRAGEERKELTRWIGEHLEELARFLPAMNALASEATRAGAPFAPSQRLNHRPSSRAADWLRLCAKQGLLHWDDDVEVVFGSAEAARYLGGSWIEEHAAAKVAGASAPGRWAAGLQVEHVDSGSRNEIDAIVVRNNHVVIVECKAAQADARADDWIYKLSQLAEQVGGKLATPVLLSARSLNKADHDRAQLYGVRVLEGDGVAGLPALLRLATS